MRALVVSPPASLTHFEYFSRFALFPPLEPEPEPEPDPAPPPRPPRPRPPSCESSWSNGLAPEGSEISWSSLRSEIEKSSSPNGSADIKLDFSISGLNEDQEISESSGAKPFDQLLSQLGGLGLGGLGGGSGSGSGSGSNGGDNANLEKYSKCVSEAGGDTTKARKCADLLTP